MRSNLLKSAASVLAMLAMLAFAAGPALAEWAMSIQTDGTFGNYSEDNDFADSAVPANNDESGDKADLLTGNYEWNLNYSAKSGPVSWKGRLRVRDDSAGNLKTHRSLLAYAISDQVTLEFHPRSFGGPSMAVGDISGVIGRFAFGDATAYIAWEDISVLNVNFNLGAATIGLGISDECQVGTVTFPGAPAAFKCGVFVTAAGGGTPNGADKNFNSMILHANGAAGAIKWGFQFVNSSGVYTATKAGPPVADDDKDVSSSGFEIGVNWAGPVQVGFTYTSIDIGCDLDTGMTGTCKPTQTMMKIGVKAGGLAVAYTANNIEVKFDTTKDTADTTNIDASYAIEIAPGVVIGPELRIQNFEAKEDMGGGATETTKQDKTLVGIAYSANF